jgi:ribosomal protein S18 acetylase RimI-like enzyme
VETRVVAAKAVPVERLRAFALAAWGSETVVAHGEAMRPADHPGFVALLGERIVGHASYRIAGDSCELTAIVADPPGRGIGSRLLEAIVSVAREAGCRSVWLTTTNDNLAALRFYQRRGFRLTALRPGAVDEARRRLKPELPLVGSDGIPMRDEIDLVRDLADGDEPDGR